MDLVFRSKYFIFHSRKSLNCKRNDAGSNYQLPSTKRFRFLISRELISKLKKSIWCLGNLVINFVCQKAAIAWVKEMLKTDFHFFSIKYIYSLFFWINLNLSIAHSEATKITNPATNPPTDWKCLSTYTWYWNAFHRFTLSELRKIFRKWSITGIPLNSEQWTLIDLTFHETENKRKEFDYMYIIRRTASIGLTRWTNVAFCNQNKFSKRNEVGALWTSFAICLLYFSTLSVTIRKTKNFSI